jgi:hypothetical protein
MAIQWTINQGDTEAVKQAVLENEDGTPADIAGLTTTLKVWRVTPFSLYFSGVPLVQPNGGADGLVSWSVGPLDGGALNPGSYTAEVQATDGSGYLASWQGPLVVLPNA